MTSQNKAILKSYFNTGDIPTEAQFAELIDSLQPRGATLTVAASNATAATIAQADYVCDGVNDEVQIQAAIDALPATGGKILLSEGTFNLYYVGMINSGFNDKYYSIKINAAHPPMTIEGIPGATTLFLANNQHAQTYMLYMVATVAAPRTNATYIRGLTFDGNASNQPDRIDAGDFCSLLVGNAARDIHVDNCRFKNWKYHPFQVAYNSFRCSVTNCYFEGQGGVRAESENIIVSNNIFYCPAIVRTGEESGVGITPDYDILISPAVRYTHWGSVVSDNLFLGGGMQLTLGCTKGVTVTGNVFANSNDGGGIYCILVASSTVDWPLDVYGNVISNNTFYNFWYGISLHTTSATDGIYNNIISNNNFFPGLDRTGVRGIFEDGPGTFANNIITNNNIQVSVAPITSIGTDIIHDNYGYKTENRGAAAAVADGGTIAHGLVATPTWLSLVASVAGEIVTATSLGAANITVAIKKNDGTPGTAQTIYWEARV